MQNTDFRSAILAGIPAELPAPKPWDPTVNHAPRRKDILTADEKKLALRNALRYFEPRHHATLAPEFMHELETYGRIYMYRFRPDYRMYARPIDEYPAQCRQAAAIMLMIQNNLDYAVAQHPHELITYGGNGAVFQNWAQYLLTMQYLATMTDTQTLTMYSGHPMGLFPSHPDAPRVVVTNGMVIPNYSGRDDYERMNALGVSQYGQMTAGSYMYIGPQGIVHGTTITTMNAARRWKRSHGSATQVKPAAHHDNASGSVMVSSAASPDDAPASVVMVSSAASPNHDTSAASPNHDTSAAPPNHDTDDFGGMLFITSGLGGMSGAQPKAAKIAGLVSITAEMNPKAVHTRHSQGWVDEVFTDLDALMARTQAAMTAKEAISLAYQGNIVDVWEKCVELDLLVSLGSDQTSLHNPFAGGYYPVGYTLEESNEMMAAEPERFQEAVYASLRRHVAAVNALTAKGMYFWDYGNAFLLESSRAHADIMAENGLDFKYRSYVQDILGPMCFDYGFGPYRWVCTSGKPEDLAESDRIALGVLEEIYQTAPSEIRGQLQDNIVWIRDAMKNNLVVGSQARILYADSEGRVKIAAAMNDAIRTGRISAPIVLGRDHHDVSGTDSPYRETSNIYDGSRFTADMAVQNFVGDGFRGATWISLHNGGGVGWGEVINGGFGMLIDGSEEADRRLRSMLFWDVNNGIARRAWARNDEALFAIRREMERTPGLKVTLPNLVEDGLLGE